MTGVIPYYGGRLTPAQAYALTHPQHAAPPPVPPPAAAGPAPSASSSRPDTLAALQHLLDAGVVSQSEYDELRTRIGAKV